MLELMIKKQVGNFYLDVEFDIGLETLALLGASGCGKSMTLKCIAGIETPDEGRIVLNDRVLFDSREKINLPPQERRVGLLFQSYALFPNMTLQENIEIAIRSSEDKSREVERLIESFSLTGLENNYPHQLSGGQQQRVALARMIINEPEMLMLDEPFSALDEHLRWQMEKELIELIESYKLPTIYVSHNKDEVYRISDSIAVMDRGRIVEKNTRENIFKHPSSIETAILIGYKNISEIDRIDSNRILAKDWNLELELDSFDRSSKFVGIDERDLKLVQPPSGHEFILADKIDNIDYQILVLKRQDSKEVYLQIDKELASSYKLGEKVHVDFDIKHINIFK